MDKQEKLERAATSYFCGLMVEYHRKMGEALIHALVNWIPVEHIADALNDVRYFSGKVIEELNRDVERHSRVDAI